MFRLVRTTSKTCSTSASSCSIRSCQSLLFHPMYYWTYGPYAMGQLTHGPMGHMESNILEYCSNCPSPLGTQSPKLAKYGQQLDVWAQRCPWTSSVSMLCQVVHPLMSTILLPVCALVVLNLRVLSRVPTVSRPRSASRRRFSI